MNGDPESKWLMLIFGIAFIAICGFAYWAWVMS